MSAQLLKFYIATAEQPHISVRLSARGLDKEMGMSGTDAVSGKPILASNWKVSLSIRYGIVEFKRSCRQIPVFWEFVLCIR